MPQNSYSFKTDLDLVEIRDSLNKVTPDIHWTCRESEYLGDYVIGETDNGVEIRIILDDEPPYIYCEFPDGVKEDEQSLFDERIREIVLPTIGAKDIKRRD